MAQSRAEKKKRHPLPKNIVEKTDAEVAEALFGKRLKRELDRAAGIEPTPTKRS